MRIGVSGTVHIGKSRFITDFLQKWPDYKTKPIDIRKLLKDNKLSVRSTKNEMIEKTQKFLLNHRIEQIINEPKDAKIILDGSVLDSLIHILWLSDANKVSNSFVRETIALVKQSLVFYDLIFFLPLSKQTPDSEYLPPNYGADTSYRDSIDILFKAVLQRYHQHSTVFFPFDQELGCPGFVEIFGKPEERIVLAEHYLNPQGEQYKEEESLVQVKPEEQPEM